MRIDRWVYIVPLRLRSIFRRSRVDAELDDEIRDHIERQTAENIGVGMTPTEARTAALHAFGNLLRTERGRPRRARRRPLSPFAQEAAFRNSIVQDANGIDPVLSTENVKPL